MISKCTAGTWLFAERTGNNLGKSSMPRFHGGSYQVNCCQLMSVNSYCLHYVVVSTDVHLSVLRLK